MKELIFKRNILKAVGLINLIVLTFSFSVIFSNSGFMLKKLVIQNHAYYVSQSGNDNNDGSFSHPFATIQKAATLATPGSTIHVFSGTYTTKLITYASGTASSPITYISDIKWGARIRTMGAEVAWDNRGDYVTITGFNISSNGSYGIFNRGSYVYISKNYIHNIPATGCSSNGGAGIADGPINGVFSGHDNYIVKNIVHDIGPKSPYCNFVHGIYEANGKSYIQNNIVYNNAAWGIHSWHNATNITITNNLVFDNGGSGGGGGIIIAADEESGAVNDNTIVSNNIVVHNANIGIAEFGSIGPHNKFLNNLVYDNHLEFSLLHGNKDQGTLNVDPQMINFQIDGTGDYHLKPTSPAIDAGTSIGAPTTDIDNIPRPQGKGFDVGPYEYMSSASSYNANNIFIITLTIFLLALLMLSIIVIQRIKK